MNLTRKGGAEMENTNKQNWRLSVQLTKEQEDALIELRKQDEFCRLSYGEIVRRLIDVGLEASKGD
jgi:hypothetical protein